MDRMIRRDMKKCGYHIRLHWTEMVKEDSKKPTPNRWDMAIEENEHIEAVTDRGMHHLKFHHAFIMSQNHALVAEFHAFIIVKKKLASIQ